MAHLDSVLGTLATFNGIKKKLYSRLRTVNNFMLEPQTSPIISSNYLGAVRVLRLF